MTKAGKLLLHTLFGLNVLTIAYFWKIQIAFGAHSLLFTASNIFGPLLGVVLGPWAVLTALFVKRFIAWNFFGAPLFSAFSTYIPMLCAAGYWNMSSRVIRLFVPTACMIAFIFHPIGFQASIYSLYWLIPIILYFVQPQSLFLHALASTFVQHAVGSVIWLYLMPTTPIFWYSLLPVVCIERILFASGMVATLEIIKICHEYLLPFLANRRILANKH